MYYVYIIYMYIYICMPINKQPCTYIANNKCSLIVSITFVRICFKSVQFLQQLPSVLSSPFPASPPELHDDLASMKTIATY